MFVYDYVMDEISIVFFVFNELLCVGGGEFILVWVRVDGSFLLILVWC